MQVGQPARCRCAFALLERIGRPGGAIEAGPTFAAISGVIGRIGGNRRRDSSPLAHVRRDGCVVGRNKRFIGRRKRSIGRGARSIRRGFPRLGRGP